MQNRSVAARCINEHRRWLFADMPYFNRWMGEHTSEICHWRLIPNALHVHEARDYPSDRADKMNVVLHDWRSRGSHVLIAPSSDTMTKFVVNADMSDKSWLDNTLHKLRKHTDRPLRVRLKPRSGKTSGPMVESISVDHDLRDCWAVVTSCSIVGVQAALAGIPVFSHPLGPAAPIANDDLANIESPIMPDRRLWANTLAYRQFTKAEMRSGLAHEILHQLL